MTAVFADTFFFLAAINSQDVFHSRAIDFSARFEGRIITTEWVLLETANALSSVPARPAFAALEDVLRHDRRVQIVPCAVDLLHRAIELYVRCSDKDWSLTDCTSFIVMGDERLVMALTGDRCFEQAGFTAILK